MNYCSVEEISRQVEAGKMLILDVRERYEYEICSIEALQIPMDELFTRLNEIPKSPTVVVMCRAGKRAEAVANMLIMEHGFDNIVVMEGGILAWIEKIANHLESY
jgi:sulfur-carrier protein adenylyltransferase/sulfurtransferase